MLDVAGSAVIIGRPSRKAWSILRPRQAAFPGRTHTGDRPRGAVWRYGTWGKMTSQPALACKRSTSGLAVPELASFSATRPYPKRPRALQSSYLSSRAARSAHRWSRWPASHSHRSWFKLIPQCWQSPRQSGRHKGFMGPSAMTYCLNTS